jgi:formylmethanofuran dehydrogenase subunit A
MSSKRHDSTENDDFSDVVQIFRNAAAVMKPGQMVFMDGFTLEDAMSVFEVQDTPTDLGSFQRLKSACRLVNRD